MATPAVVAHACNFSIWGTEAGRSQVQGLFGEHGEILFQKRGEGMGAEQSRGKIWLCSSSSVFKAMATMSFPCRIAAASWLLTSPPHTHTPQEVSLCEKHVIRGSSSRDFLLHTKCLQGSRGSGWAWLAAFIVKPPLPRPTLLVRSSSSETCIQTTLPYALAQSALRWFQVNPMHSSITQWSKLSS